jgi:hypothetical protein
MSYLYRVSQGEYAELQENIPWIKPDQQNQKHLYPKLNGCVFFYLN